jgi:hypothetical protein
MRLFGRDYYAALAHLGVGEGIPDLLVEHLLSVGYTRRRRRDADKWRFAAASSTCMARNTSGPFA